ncbi:hypothetical protein EAG_13410 [Camponotus floridanus]|uniref:Uncharacterized protein n=1 Tax=Camponotus floridanus TaxID=104421 RepID=E2A239_CAMFO|nr:hypothetical protein EAG_13410 [Camponotus floridanus]
MWWRWRWWSVVTTTVLVMLVLGAATAYSELSELDKPSELPVLAPHVYLSLPQITGNPLGLGNSYMLSARHEISTVQRRWPGISATENCLPATSGAGVRPNSLDIVAYRHRCDT